MAGKPDILRLVNYTNTFYRSIISLNHIIYNLLPHHALINSMFYAHKRYTHISHIVAFTLLLSSITLSTNSPIGTSLFSLVVSGLGSEQ